MKRRDFIKATASGGLLIGILAVIGHTADEDATLEPIEAHGGETVEPHCGED